MKKSILIASVVTALIVVAVACTKTESNVSTGTVIKTVTVDSLSATLSNGTGQLKQGNQELTLAFTDSSGKAVEVGAVSLNFHMPAMGGMAAMNDAVTFTTTGTPGVYRGKVDVEVVGNGKDSLLMKGRRARGRQR